MAIDTENKRRSCIAVLPVPDGTIGQADRQQTTWNYAGILAALYTVEPPIYILAADSHVAQAEAYDGHVGGVRSHDTHVAQAEAMDGRNR